MAICMDQKTNVLTPTESGLLSQDNKERPKGTCTCMRFCFHLFIPPLPGSLSLSGYQPQEQPSGLFFLPDSTSATHPVFRQSPIQVHDDGSSTVVYNVAPPLMTRAAFGLLFLSTHSPMHNLTTLPPIANLLTTRAAFGLLFLPSFVHKDTLEYTLLPPPKHCSLTMVSGHHTYNLHPANHESSLWAALLCFLLFLLPPSPMTTLQ